MAQIARHPQTIALVDESMRMTGAGLYVLAFTFVALDRVDHARATLRTVPRDAPARFHWYAERHKDRLAMIDLLSELDVSSTVVYQTPSPPRKQEQARARCLAVGIHELAAAGAVRLVLEQRQQRLNQRDERTVASCRRDGLVSPSVPFAFARPGDEPLLWMPDTIAGAVGADLGEGNPTYTERLQPARIAIRQVPAP